MGETENNKENQEMEISDTKKLPYPKSIFFIVVTEFCERFSYYGMRAVLTIYMRNVLNFSDDLSTTIYHIFLLLCYGLPVFGGILADSFLGKYKTIIYLSSVYAIGNMVLTAASIQPFHLPAVAVSLTGLLLMAIGTGGIKPCVVALGGEQFIMPQQEKVMKQFFAVFLFTVSIGSMVATISTPVLRRDISCFGETTCYPLAFGVPGILMAVAICVFIGGRCLYNIKPPDENIFVRVVKCALYAVKERLRNKDASSKKLHWLDYAGSRYDNKLINDSKGLFRVLVYYLPVPMFFALYEQLGSRWTLQATRMNGYISGGFVIKPDQMQVANAVLLFMFIPFFETLVYPVFHKCNLLKRPLQKMVIGGILASLSFVAAGIVETNIHSTYAVEYNNANNYLNFINTISCPVHIQAQGQGQVGDPQWLKFEPITILPDENAVSSPLSHWQNTTGLQISTGEGCLTTKPFVGHLSLGPGVVSAVISELDGQVVVTPLTLPESVTKSKEGNAKLRVILSSTKHTAAVGINVMNGGVTSYYKKLNGSSSLAQFTETFEIEPNNYHLAIVWDSENTTRLPIGYDMGTGGSYVISVSENVESMDLKEQLITLTPQNQVHMLWLLPQYVLIAWAEVLFIISGMEFSFTEAPESMKSVVQSCWHLANAMGNAIVIISAQLNVIQMYEFFGFATLMGIDTLILCLMAIRYKYVSESQRNSARRNSFVEQVESKF